MPVSKALAKQTMAPEEVTKYLMSLGVIEQTQNEFNRIRVEGASFIIDDVPHISNPKTGTPAFRARLVSPPIEYQAAWLTEELAEVLGRSNAANSFCKSYFDDPAQGRKRAEDGTSCEACPISPFIKRENLPLLPDGQIARKCQWKGDLRLQIVQIDDEGNTSLDDPTIYTLSLPTTGMIEFKGTARDRVRGHTSDKNFLQKLAELGGLMNEDDPKRGMADAFTAFALGAVIVDVFSIATKSQDGSRSYYVVSLDPTAILELDDLPALPEGEKASDGGSDIDDLPF